MESLVNTILGEEDKTAESKIGKGFFSNVEFFAENSLKLENSPLKKTINLIVELHKSAEETEKKIQQLLGAPLGTQTTR